MTPKMTEKIQELLEEAYRRGKEAIPGGNVATYIPELGKADPQDLGISICTREFEHFNIGRTDKRFTIQSISKIVSLAIALDMFGPDKVFRLVDMEPSGEAFNSLIDLDTKSGATVTGTRFPLIAFNVSSAKTDEEGRALLKAFGMPFKK